MTRPVANSPGGRTSRRNGSSTRPVTLPFGPTWSRRSWWVPSAIAVPRGVAGAVGEVAPGAVLAAVPGAAGPEVAVPGVTGPGVAAGVVPGAAGEMASGVRVQRPSLSVWTSPIRRL